MGGSVDRPAWDTEFGRMAAVADDQGAHFMLMADPWEAPFTSMMVPVENRAPSEASQKTAEATSSGVATRP
jgi:hypothetical protein